MGNLYLKLANLAKIQSKLFVKTIALLKTLKVFIFQDLRLILMI